MAETTQESTGIPEETPVYHDISPYVEGDLRASYHMVADLTEQSRDTGEMLTKSYYTTSRGNGEDDKITVTAGLSFDQVQQEFPESLGKLTHFLHMDPDTINKSFDRFTVCKVEYLDGKGQEASYAFVDPASNENLAEQAEESNDVHYDMMDHFAKCTVNNVSSRSFDGLMDADSERADMHILPYQELAAGGGLEDAVDNDTEEEMEGSSDEDPDLWENYDDFDTDSEVDEESFDAYDVLIQDMAEHGESTGPDIPADYHPASDFADYAEEEESESYQDYDWIYSPIDQEPEPEMTTQGTAVDQKDDRTFLQQHSDELFPHIEDSSNESDSYTRNRIRHQLLPLLVQENPSVLKAIGRTTELLREDDACLCREAEAFLETWESNGAIPSKRLLELEPAVACRVIRLLCGNSVSMERTKALLAFAKGSERGVLEIPGRKIRRERGLLYFQGRN